MGRCFLQKCCRGVFVQIILLTRIIAANVDGLVFDRLGRGVLFSTVFVACLLFYDTTNLACLMSSRIFPFSNTVGCTVVHFTVTQFLGAIVLERI
jgi:hypothetical protein